MSSERQVIAAIGLGSNLDDRGAHLGFAIGALAGLPRTRMVARSSVIETQAVGAPTGGDPGGPYLNAAALLRTILPATELLARLHEIERARGRDRTAEAGKWRPRTLDLDLLVYGDRVIDEAGLRVPHPRMHERAFVLEPLAEIAPEMLVPTLGKTVRALLEEVAGRTPGGRQEAVRR